MKLNYRGQKKIKLQSVMEYLITHMWALLIIAIALAALFELGIFTPSPPQQCILSDGLVCKNFFINSQGSLTIQVFNSGTTPMNITGVACYQNSSDIIYQKEGNINGQVALSPGGTVTLYTNCYGSNNNIYTSSYGSFYGGDLSITFIDSRTGISGDSYGSISVITKNGAVNNQAGIIYSVSVTLTNTESSPTPNNFQQELVINPSSYAQYGLNANLSNLEFSTNPYGGGTPIYSWIANGSSITSTKSVIWVNLPSVISANGGTETIYMNFFSNNNPILSGYTGYAPQLYCSSGCFQTAYGEYDNGVNVFSTYSNFKGTSLSSIFYSPQSCSSGLSIDNGYTMNTFYCGNYQYQTLAHLNLPQGYGGILLSNVESINGPSGGSGVIWCWLLNGGCQAGGEVTQDPVQIISEPPTSGESLYTIDSLSANSITDYRTFTLSYLGIAGYPPGGQMPNVNCNVGVCSN